MLIITIDITIMIAITITIMQTWLKCYFVLQTWQAAFTILLITLIL